MQITLSSIASEKMEQIIQHLCDKFDVEELMPDELIDAMINHSLDLMITKENTLVDCRDRLVDRCSLKVGIRVGTGVKYEENDEYRG